MSNYELGPETERLVMRAMTVDDAEAFFALQSDPDVMRYVHEPLVESLDAARDALANYPDFKSVGYGRWGCVLKETQQLIGFCGLKFLSDLDEVDVGYRLLPEYWGRGFATEACRASVEFGFETLNLRRIIGITLPENIASKRVLEKAGLQRERDFHYDGQQAELYGLNRI